MQDDLSQNGHAIECRVYAEDPSNGFLPATGRVIIFEVPNLPGVRVDAGIVEGNEITIHYDPMIAKIIVHGTNREMAIRRLRYVLNNTIVLGVTTNVSFLLAILDDSSFSQGNIDTAYVDTHLTSILPDDAPPNFLELSTIALLDVSQGMALQISSDGNGDVFSPWSRADGFRIG